MIWIARTFALAWSGYHIHVVWKKVIVRGLYWSDSDFDGAAEKVTRRNGVEVVRVKARVQVLQNIQVLAIVLTFFIEIYKEVSMMVLKMRRDWMLYITSWDKLDRKDSWRIASKRFLT